MSRRVDDLYRGFEIQRTNFDPGPSNGPMGIEYIFIALVIIAWIVASKLYSS